MTSAGSRDTRVAIGVALVARVVAVASGRMELVRGGSRATLRAIPTPEFLLEIDGVPYVITQVSPLTDSGGVRHADY